MTEAEREKAVNQEIALIEKENNEGGKYTVSVRSFFQGNEYYYFVYQDYKDVRLVGVPPESLGKFGLWFFHYIQWRNEKQGSPFEYRRYDRYKFRCIEQHQHHRLCSKNITGR
jgi:hypothetical protein